MASCEMLEFLIGLSYSCVGHFWQWMRGVSGHIIKMDNGCWNRVREIFRGDHMDAFHLVPVVFRLETVRISFREP